MSKRVISRAIGICLVLMIALTSFMVACGEEPAPAPAPSPAPSPAPAPAPSPAPAEPVELKFASPLPEQDYMSYGMLWWAEEAEKRTGGMVKATLFAGGALGPPSEYTGMVRSGAISGALVDNNFQPGEFPMFDVFSMPFMIDNPRIAADVAYQLLSEGLIPGLNDYKTLFFQPLQPNLLYTTDTKITRMEDVKGLKIKTLGASAQLIESFGGVQVHMPTSEVYMALSQGTIDGGVTPFHAIKLFKWFEVADYAVADPIINAFANVFVLSKDIWDSFPPDIKYTLEVLNEETRYLQARNLADGIVYPTDADAEELGMTLTRLTLEEKARWSANAQPIIEQWIADNEAKGLPAAEAIDLIRRTVLYER